ncbi:MAG: hypothetical protein WBP59_10865, partial [Ilumatobacteraceae bacterium]
MALNAFFERHSSIVARLNTSVAQIWLSGPPVSVGTAERFVISVIACSRVLGPILMLSFLIDREGVRGGP